MAWKTIIALASVAIIAGGVVWIVDGMEVLSKDRVEFTVEVTDALFGTKTMETRYEDGFRFGLLPLDDSPGSLPKSYAFVLGISVTSIVVSLVMLRRRKNA